ncbi:MAG: hypothetical protein KUG79_03950 [Pseudomonadales bacterium]|nr:hypothetical protein [Pseudomonadales bacterium]
MTRLLGLLAFSCLLLTNVTISSANASDTIAGPVQQVLITHNDNNRQTEVLRRSVRAMYSMRMRTWPDGSPLTVYVLLDDDPLHQQFCRDTLGILPFHLRRSWDRLIFSGKGQPPIAVKNMQEMKQKISETPGAIGYITGDQVDASVTILKIL